MQRGLTLIEIMVALLVASLFCLGLYYVLLVPGKTFRQTTASFESDEIRKNLILWIQNDVAWRHTLADPANASFECIRRREDCRGATGSFRVRNEKGQVFYDALTSVTSGYTEKGTPCSTFGVNGGDSLCPFRIDLSWTALCPAAQPPPAAPPPCFNPQVRVLGVSHYKPTPGRKKEELVLRTANYGVIDFVRASVIMGVGTGTPDRLAMWKTVVLLEDSVATETGGKLGVGVTNPAVGIEVAGSMAVGDYAGAEAAPAQSLIVSGKVGIGTDSPVAALDVAGGLRVADDPTAACGPDLFGAVKWTGSEFQGCFDGAPTPRWCSLAKGCTP